MSIKNEAPPAAEQASTPDEGRREALRKLGKFGAYTAPAMLALLLSEKAVAQSDGGGGACSANTDCPPGFICQNGVCVPGPV
jgi:hypothetical protein